MVLFLNTKDTFKLACLFLQEVVAHAPNEGLNQPSTLKQRRNQDTECYQERGIVLNLLHQARLTGRTGELRYQEAKKKYKQLLKLKRMMHTKQETNQLIQAAKENPFIVLALRKLRLETNIQMHAWESHFTRILSQRNKSKEENRKMSQALMDFPQITTAEVTVQRELQTKGLATEYRREDSTKLRGRFHSLIALASVPEKIISLRDEDKEEREKKIQCFLGTIGLVANALFDCPGLDELEGDFDPENLPEPANEENTNQHPYPQSQRKHELEWSIDIQHKNKPEFRAGEIGGSSLSSDSPAPVVAESGADGAADVGVTATPVFGLPLGTGSLLLSDMLST
ncbi:hypothetical protein C0J52_18271 [Blattella germanica]|nr:hypothetical protein C0J52_18271 [Blattella germanica]